MGSSFQTLDQKMMDALFEDKIQGVVALCYENERPLQGVAGSLDWYFHGLISQYAYKGFFSKNPGECTYIPIRKKDHAYHLILVNGGESRGDDPKSPVSAALLKKLAQNLKTLKLTKIGISKNDFGNPSDSFLKTHFEGISLCLTQ